MHERTTILAPRAHYNMHLIKFRVSQLTLTALDAGTPCVVKIRIAGIATLLKPRTATHATTEYAVGVGGTLSASDRGGRCSAQSLHLGRQTRAGNFPGRLLECRVLDRLRMNPRGSAQYLREGTRAIKHELHRGHA